MKSKFYENVEIKRFRRNNKKQIKNCKRIKCCTEYCKLPRCLNFMLCDIFKDTTKGYSGVTGKF
jgi:hypothetical protein